MSENKIKLLEQASDFPQALAAAIAAATGATPVIADEFIFWQDSSGELRSVTWANILTNFVNYLLDEELFSDASHSHAGLVTNGDSHNHVGGDGAPLNYGVPYGMYTNTTVPATTTHYGAPYKPGLDANNINWPVLEAGTFSLLTVRKASGAAQPATGSFTVTLYLNNVATALVVTFVNADGAGGLTKVDNSNTVAVVAGDLIRWEARNNASSTSPTYISIEMAFKKATT